MSASGAGPHFGMKWVIFIRVYIQSNGRLIGGVVVGAEPIFTKHNRVY